MLRNRDRRRWRRPFPRPHTPLLRQLLRALLNVLAFIWVFMPFQPAVKLIPQPGPTFVDIGLIAGFAFAGAFAFRWLANRFAALAEPPRPADRSVTNEYPPDEP
jgi:hypothetical protein